METQQHIERVEKMKNDGKDIYDVKKAEEVLEETRLMIPDAVRRLNVALDELETLMVRHSCYLSIRILTCRM